MFAPCQNLKEVYNATFQAFPEEIRSSHNGDVLSYLNGSLDILDLGCGTGLIGSWFKDYANKIVGVDISPTMLDMATKKGCYHELRRGVSECFHVLTPHGLSVFFEGYNARLGAISTTSYAQG